MASGTGGTSTGAVVSSGNAVQLKPVEVSKALQEGEKFIKWDEVGFYHVINFCYYKIILYSR